MAIIDAIPKEWPRVFSVVSIGFLGIYSAIEVWGDLKNQGSFSIVEWAQSSVDPLSSFAAGLVVFLSVFAAYTVGELVTTTAPIYVTHSQKRRRRQMLLAAQKDNSGLVRDVLRKADLKVEFFCGFFMVAVLGYLAKLITMASLGAYATATFQIPGIALSCLFFLYSKHMALRDIDLLITFDQENAPDLDRESD
jgi:ABC-type glycerol-3-phosphate transport system permease component